MGYYQFCTWVTRLAYVNLLWIGFTILGLGIFGFFPATVSMFAVIRKWLTGETDISVFTTFWKNFKTEFYKVNVLGYILLAIGAILYIDLMYVKGQPGMLFTVLQFGLLFLFFIYFIILLYVFPIFVHFKCSFKDYLKWSIILGIGNPILTALMLVAAVIAFLATFMVIPALMVFFGGSVITFVIMWGAFQSFTKLEYTEKYN